MIALAGISLISCAQITPIPDERQTVAYEGNDETGGIIRFLPDGSLEISPSARTRYNSLVGQYGDNFYPSYSKDYGVMALMNGNYAMTLEAAERFKKLVLKNQREKIEK